MAERDFNLQMTGEQVKDALQQLEDRVAEGWAVGEHDGVPVTSGSPYYHNNSAWWAQQAGLSATAAADSAATAEQEVEEGIRQGIVGTYVQESATPGAIVTIDDGADDVPLKDLKVNLAIVQPGTGDPSPTNVRPIYPVTEAEVSVSGKNLLNPATLGVYDVTGTGTTRYGFAPIKVDAGSYTLSKASGSVATYITNITAGYTNLQAINFPYTFTISETSWIMVRTGSASSSGYDLVNVQLEKGTTATDYEPYAGQQYLVNIGINQWDEEWELGGISNSTGQNGGASDRIRSTNYIPCQPSTTYYFKLGGSNWNVYYYGKDKSFLSYVGSYNDNRTLTTPSGAYYMRFWKIGTTSSGDISINYPSRFTSYYPYTGKVVYGGELDVTTGVLTAKYASVDMGDLAWGQNYYVTSAYNVDLTDAVKGATGEIANVFCDTYATAPTVGVTNLADKSIMMANGSYRLVAHDSSYVSDPSAFKTAMAGHKLVYELATPISIQLTPTEVDTLRGDNVIWADCGDITNCEYRADLKMYIDKVVGA